MNISDYRNYRLIKWPSQRNHKPLHNFPTKIILHLHPFLASLCLFLRFPYLKPIIRNTKYSTPCGTVTRLFCLPRPCLPSSPQPLISTCPMPSYITRTRGIQHLRYQNPSLHVPESRYTVGDKLYYHASKKTPPILVFECGRYPELIFILHARALCQRVS